MPNSFSSIELPAEFFQIAQNVYSGDPHWIPEDIKNIRQQFSSTNPYFESCNAKVFISKTEARIVGFYNPDLEIEDEKIAYFGFWETKNNLSVNADLFRQVERWAEECGASRIYGPINFSTYQNNRLRVDGFDNTSFIDEPYNPDYYPRLLAELGYEKKYGYATGINENIPNLILQVNAPFSMLKKQSEKTFTFERLTGDIWLNNLEKLYPLVENIFSKNFAYTAISWETFKSQCGENFSKKLCPKTSIIVYDLQGDIAGFFITYPDYGSLVNQQAQVEETELLSSNVNYQQHYPLLKQPRLLLAKTCGVAPKYRSAGLFPLMSMQLSIWAEGHYEHVSGAMMREDNASMSFYKSLIKAGNKDFVMRNYALFTKRLENNDSSSVMEECEETDDR
jgi:hypothetical protein